MKTEEVFYAKHQGLIGGGVFKSIKPLIGLTHSYQSNVLILNPLINTHWHQSKSLKSIEKEATQCHLYITLVTYIYIMYITKPPTSISLRLFSCHNSFKGEKQKKREETHFPFYFKQRGENLPAPPRMLWECHFHHLAQSLYLPSQRPQSPSLLP